VTLSDDDPRHFTVTPGGETVELNTSADDHEPDAESRRRAKLLAQGGNFAPDAEDFFAHGIAVARSGGDLRTWLDGQLKNKGPSVGRGGNW
jgi:hypothetical protein